MVDMPDEVANVVDSEVDAYWTEWPRPRRCEHCGEFDQVRLALVNATTGEELLYCWWQCIAPLESDEDWTGDGAVENSDS
jgi:hypothetical protein